MTHTRYLNTDCILELGKTQRFPSSVVPEQPNKQRSEAHTKGKDLPEQNAVRPDVAQRGVEVVEDALGGHPLHGEEGLQGRRKEGKPSVHTEDPQRQEWKEALYRAKKNLPNNVGPHECLLCVLLAAGLSALRRVPGTSGCSINT